MKKLSRFNWRKWLPALLYGLFALCWAAGGLVGFVQNRAATPVTLDAATASAEGLADTADGYQTLDGDAKLIFPNIGQPARYMQLSADFSHTPGEMDAFFNAKPGQGYSVRRRLLGAPQSDGSYLYTLPPFTTVDNLRLDLGTQAENHITLHSITLNPRLPAAHFWPLTLRSMAAFAALPALALCVIYTIMEGYRAVKIRLYRRPAPAARPPAR